MPALRPALSTLSRSLTKASWCGTHTAGSAFRCGLTSAGIGRMDSNGEDVQRIMNLIEGLLCPRPGQAGVDDFLTQTQYSPNLISILLYVLRQYTDPEPFIVGCIVLRKACSRFTLDCVRTRVSKERKAQRNGYTHELQMKDAMLILSFLLERLLVQCPDEEIAHPGRVRCVLESVLQTLVGYAWEAVLLPAVNESLKRVSDFVNQRGNPNQLNNIHSLWSALRIIAIVIGGIRQPSPSVKIRQMLNSISRQYTPTLTGALLSICETLVQSSNQNTEVFQPTAALLSCTIVAATDSIMAALAHGAVSSDGLGQMSLYLCTMIPIFARAQLFDAVAAIFQMLLRAVQDIGERDLGESTYCASVMSASQLLPALVGPRQCYDNSERQYPGDVAISAALSYLTEILEIAECGDSIPTTNKVIMQLTQIDGRAEFIRTCIFPYLSATPSQLARFNFDPLTATMDDLSVQSQVATLAEQIDPGDDGLRSDGICALPVQHAALNLLSIALTMGDRSPQLRHSVMNMAMNIIASATSAYSQQEDVAALVGLESALSALSIASPDGENQQADEVSHIFHQIVDCATKLPLSAHFALRRIPSVVTSSWIEYMQQAQRIQVIMDIFIHFLNSGLPSLIISVVNAVEQVSALASSLSTYGCRQDDIMKPLLPLLLPLLNVLSTVVMRSELEQIAAPLSDAISRVLSYCGPSEILSIPLADCLERVWKTALDSNAGVAIVTLLSTMQQIIIALDRALETTEKMVENADDGFTAVASREEASARAAAEQGAAVASRIAFQALRVRSLPLEKQALMLLQEVISRRMHTDIENLAISVAGAAFERQNEGTGGATSLFIPTLFILKSSAACAVIGPAEAAAFRTELIACIEANQGLPQPITIRNVAMDAIQRGGIQVMQETVNNIGKMVISEISLLLTSSDADMLPAAYSSAVQQSVLLVGLALHLLNQNPAVLCFYLDALRSLITADPTGEAITFGPNLLTAGIAAIGLRLSLVAGLHNVDPAIISIFIRAILSILLPQQTQGLGILDIAPAVYDRLMLHRAVSSISSIATSQAYQQKFLEAHIIQESLDIASKQCSPSSGDIDEIRRAYYCSILSSQKTSHAIGALLATEYSQNERETTFSPCSIGVPRGSVLRIT